MQGTASEKPWGSCKSWDFTRALLTTTVDIVGDFTPDLGFSSTWEFLYKWPLPQLGFSSQIWDFSVLGNFWGFIPRKTPEIPSSCFATLEPIFNHFKGSGGQQHLSLTFLYVLFVEIVCLHDALSRFSCTMSVLSGSLSNLVI